MKKHITFTAYITIEVDTENDVVKDYESMDDLCEDVMDYRFSSALPVIEQGAVTVENINVEDVEA